MHGNHKSNLEKKADSVKAILRVLSDENWHTYGELLRITKISSRTLTKRLDDLLECKFIQKEKREYPSAYFKAEPEVITYTNATLLREELSETIEPMLIESKNPIFVLELINMSTSLSYSHYIKEIKNKDVSESRLNFLLEIFVWEPYINQTWKLLKACRKNKDIINIEEINEYELNKTLRTMINSKELLGRK